MRLVLYEAALNALAGPPTQAQRQARKAMTAALRTRRDVTVPTVILAKVYRGAGRNQIIDVLLARNKDQALELRDTDRVLARLVGAVLTAASGAGSEDLADAHVVATAGEAGGGVILTIDEADLNRLAGLVTPRYRRTTPSRGARASSRGGRLSFCWCERDTASRRPAIVPLLGAPAVAVDGQCSARLNPLGILTRLPVVGDPGVEGPGVYVSIPWGF